MKIQTFSNMKGLLYGADPKRVECDKAGVLKIGMTEVSIIPGAESILPLLVNGCTGDYKATFTDNSGNVYELDRVAVRGGRVLPPPQTAVDFMELRCRMDSIETKFEELRGDIRDLKNIFDTNSLNFLIYEGDET